MAITKQAPAAKAQGISLSPETYGESGLLDDANVSVTEAAFLMWDYNGTVNPAAPALGIEYTDEDGKTHSQYYTAGDARYFVPSEDGKMLIPAGDKTGIQRTCNAALFLSALINAGFPVDKLEDGDISILTGMQCHVKREAQPKRPGIAPRANDNGRGDATILLVDTILRLPWDKAAVGKGANKTNPAAAAAAAAADEGTTIDSELEEIIMGIVAEGSIAKAAMCKAVVAAANGNPNKAKISALAYKDSWLKDAARPFKYEGGKLFLEE